MQIVIDINEEEYEDILNGIEHARIAGVPIGILNQAIENGTPLPKGYGRLIDINDIEWAKHKEERNYMEYEVIDWEDILNAPTIIEADTERSEDAQDSN